MISQAYAKDFNLLKYFSRASAIIMTFVALAIGTISFFIMNNDLIKRSESMHQELTKILASTVQEDLIKSMADLGKLPTKELRADLRLINIDHEVRKLFSNSQEVLKVKILDLNARVIYSTDESQIGHQNPLNYIGSNTATTGDIISKFEEKNDWETLRGKLKYVEILSSYVPVQVRGTDNRLLTIAVAEIYSDIGNSKREIIKDSLLISFWSLTLLSALYFTLLIIVQRAAQIIRNQSTEIQKQKEVLFYASKINSLGEMAASIAHEINNPLAIIETRARKVQNLIKEDVYDKEILIEQVKSIRETVKRISTIVRGMKKIAKNGESDSFQLIHLETILAETLSLYRETFKDSQVELVTKIDPPELVIECRVAQICQCILNVVTNAFQAVENLPIRKISIDASLEGEYLKLAITDSGSGIPQDLQSKIFEPMFTTKEVGRGAGLGLSITANIIKDHNGKFYIDTSNANTSFVILLPLTQGLSSKHNIEVAKLRAA